MKLKKALTYDVDCGSCDFFASMSHKNTDNIDKIFIVNMHTIGKARAAPEKKWRPYEKAKEIFAS